MASHEHATGFALDDFDPERPQPFDTPWGSFALYSIDGRLVAAESFCPHLLGPLFQGTRSSDEITCPWHAWRYSLTSGACVYSPEDEGAATRIQFLAVRVDMGGQIVLVGPPQDGAPAGSA